MSRRFQIAASALFLLLLTRSGLAAVAPGQVAAELPPVFQAEPLRVRLFDPYHLLSREAERWLRREVALVFPRSGFGVRFVGRGSPAVIPATLYPELPDRWKIAQGAIGVAIGEPGKRRSVFLSLGAAERALGLPRAERTRWNGPDGGTGRRGTDRRPRQLGIALGRVLAHELTHTIAPECPHTRSGLMAERLSRRMLTAPALGFDPLATRHLQRAARRSEASGSG